MTCMVTVNDIKYKAQNYKLNEKNSRLLIKRIAKNTSIFHDDILHS